MSTVETFLADAEPRATNLRAREEADERDFPPAKKARKENSANEAKGESEQWKTTSVRQYLENTINPILLQGMQHIARTRPEDPLEALADFLKRNNPKRRPTAVVD